MCHAVPLCRPLDIEGEWVDAARVAAHLRTTAGCQIQWQVFIEELHGAEGWADCSADDNLRIDASFMTDKLTVKLSVPEDSDNFWMIDFNSMVQSRPRISKTSTARHIRRIVIAAPKLTT